MTAPDPKQVFIAIGKHLWRTNRWAVIATLLIAVVVVIIAIA